MSKFRKFIGWSGRDVPEVGSAEKYDSISINTESISSVEKKMYNIDIDRFNSFFVVDQSTGLIVKDGSFDDHLKQIRVDCVSKHNNEVVKNLIKWNLASEKDGVESITWHSWISRNSHCDFKVMKSLTTFKVSNIPYWVIRMNNGDTFVTFDRPSSWTNDMCD